MTPQDFITKWGPGGPAHTLNERQGAQPHFIDLCQLLGVPTPGSAGDYIFEQDTLVLGEARGYADVFYRDHFAWENKAPGKNLDAALKQLLTYSLALANPPLLVVCDRLTIRIHTQFNGHPSEVHTVLLAELDQPAKQTLLRRLWTDPESFRPQKTSRDITEAAAKSFATLADGLRRRKLESAEGGMKRQKLGSDHNFAQQNLCSDPNLVNPDQVHDEIAHFLTQCLFCFFAEDVGLLPERMFEGLVNNKQLTSDKLTRGLTNLFTVMRDGGLYGNDDIPWFNGGLFKRVNVPALSIMEVTELRNAAALNWSAIDVSIFGTLFERGLDPAKRSQLGAHYTDPATILRIVEPVLTRPLLQQWELLTLDLKGLMAKSTKKGDKHYKAAKAKFVLWLESLKAYRVLDPACGSGNFLFMGLKALKDIEHKSHLDAAAMGLDREADLVTGPHNVLGIELNEYAAELARVTVWIGELQWRMAHGYEFKTNPVLEPLDHIECRDALLSFSNSSVKSEDSRSEPGARVAQTPSPHTLRFLKSGSTSAPPTPLSAVGVHEALAEMGSDPNFVKQNLGSDPTSAGSTQNSCADPTSAISAPPFIQATEAPWPKANVVIGNPPFLGGSKKRRELGDDYFKALDAVFAGRVPGGADLVCYWFEKARAQMAAGQLQAAGLVATNSIRGGSNRKVLERIQSRPTMTALTRETHDGDHLQHSQVHSQAGNCGLRDASSRGHDRGALRSVGRVDHHDAGQQVRHDRPADGTQERHQQLASGTARYQGRPDQVGDGGTDCSGRSGGHAGQTALNIAIYAAWGDEPWVNEGAAVRVSLVCFGQTHEPSIKPLGTTLNGVPVDTIHADLTPGHCGQATADLTTAQRLPEAEATCFMGASKKAPFDIDGSTARSWLALPNPHGKSNAEVLRPLCNGIDLTRRWGDRWIVDFGTCMAESEAMFFEAPYAYVSSAVRPLREKNNREAYRKFWWRHAEARPGMRAALAPLPRYIITAAVAKHRTFIWMHSVVLPDQATLATARSDDTTFGILHSRFHELWSLRMCTWLGVGNDPRYTPTTCFETFPFPAGLTPQDTAHQQTETLPDGAVIPANIDMPNKPLAPVNKAQPAINSEVKNASQSKAPEVGLARMSGPISKSEAYEAPASEPTPPGTPTKTGAKGIENLKGNEIRTQAAAIAQAAKRLNDLRENWLNPPEWTHKVPEVMPLGLDKSPYPDRIEPKPGLSETDLKALQKRTLTNLYNAKPAWLAMAHQQLDATVAAAYGWTDYTAAMPDDEILKRLLALNLARSANISNSNHVTKP